MVVVLRLITSLSDSAESPEHVSFLRSKVGIQKKGMLAVSRIRSLFAWAAYQVFQFVSDAGYHLTGSDASLPHPLRGPGVLGLDEDQGDTNAEGDDASYWHTGWGLFFLYFPSSANPSRPEDRGSRDSHHPF